VAADDAAPPPPPPPDRPRDPLLTARLGRGDTFEVRVYQEPELTGLYRVTAEGTFDFPFCGRVAVEGRTPNDVADTLRTCLAKMIKDPQVVVVAKEVNSRKVFVFGLVQRPGTFLFEDNMSVIQAITLAGGLAQYANPNKTSVLRLDDAGQEQKYVVPVDDITQGRSSNFYLQPGDIVFVPEGLL